MKRKLLLGVSAIAAASMMFAAPVMAKSFTNADGNISIELPSDEWHEVIDPSAEFVFTNGVDVISAKKYGKDEKVEVARNDEHYNAVLQLSYAYTDQLIVLTAQVVDAPHLEEVYKSISTIKFSGISSTNEVKKDVNNYTVEGADMTLYVNAGEGLNLRDNYSISSNVLTTIPYGASVHVTGIVKLDGKEIGWNKVEYNGMSGYVSSANLTSSKPEEKKTNPTFEEIADKISYYQDMYHGDGTPEHIAYLNDGTMLDMNGNKVVGFADGACQMYDGTIIYDFDPTKMTLDEYLSGSEPGVVTQRETTAAGDSILTSADGSRQVAIYYQHADGNWYDYDGNQYWQNEAGIWFNLSDDSEWY